MPALTDREKFLEAARRVGAEVVECTTLDEALRYIAARAQGPLLLPEFSTGRRLKLSERLCEAGCESAPPVRGNSPAAAAGLTGANFALAETGTVVLESTGEDIRLATTLPERHFVLLDPRKIVPDTLAAVPLLRRFHQERPRNFLAYITGPSRTADIERVLTIGVHGPRELHILLLEGISEDPMEM